MIQVQGRSTHAILDPMRARYGHVLLSTWVTDQERTVLAAAEMAPGLGDDASSAPGHTGASNAFNQVTAWQARPPREGTVVAPSDARLTASRSDLRSKSFLTRQPRRADRVIFR